MHVHFIIHEEYEGPGAMVEWCKHRHYEYTQTRIWMFEEMPYSVEGIDLLIVMGGPQACSTPREECPHFDVGAEKALIRRFIDVCKPVIGICLGAQLIGEAFGAPPVPSPEIELGWWDITLSDATKGIVEFNNLPTQLEAFHWHTEMPGLSPGARVLAYSKGCPRQIVQYTDNIFAFQCHLEMTQRGAKEVLCHLQDQVKENAGGKFVQTSARILSGDFGRANAVLRMFLDALVAKRFVTNEEYGAYSISS